MLRQSWLEAFALPPIRVAPAATARFSLSAILLCCLAVLATDARGGNVLVNPGFETGDFSGWGVASCCPFAELLTVTQESPHSGSYVAEFNGPGADLDDIEMSLEQSIAAIATEEVNEVSYWMRSTEGDGGGCQFRAHYADGTVTASNCPAVAAEWQKVDVTSILTPGKMLNRILVFNRTERVVGLLNRDFFDDFLVDVDTQATFTVSKTFSDSNPANVPVMLGCSDGTEVNLLVTPGSPALYLFEDFDAGVSCTITEEPVPGYSVGYSADCVVAAVENGGSYDCAITNTQQPITILASKVYAAGSGPSVTFEASCDAGTLTVINATAAPGEPAEFELFNFPYAGTTCSITEPAPPAGYFEAASTCEGLSIAVGVEPVTCEITNAVTRTTFLVTKTFSDGNPGEIEATISCNTGLPLEQSQGVSPGEPVEFVVGDFDSGELDCTITEDDQAGYVAVYNNGPGTSPTGCEYTAIEGGEEFTCAITNTPAPVEIDITKEWLFEGSSDPQGVDQHFELTLYCDAEIIGGYPFGAGVEVPQGQNGPVVPLCGLFPLAEAPQGKVEYADWCLAFSGEGSDEFTAEVIPEFPDSDCFVVERLFDDAVEVDNGCGDLTVSAGVGDSCTITNTVFFEGIPTLSRTALAMLALLMLIAGFVGLRRPA